jgi:hypothetical protein
MAMCERKGTRCYQADRYGFFGIGWVSVGEILNRRKNGQRTTEALCTKDIKEAGEYDGSVAYGGDVREGCNAI